MEQQDRVHWGFVAFFAALGGYYLVTLILAVTTDLAVVDPPLLLLTFLPNVVLGIAPAFFARRMGVVPTLRDVKVGLACGCLSLLAAVVLGMVLLQVHDETVTRSPLQNFSERSVWLALAALFLVLGAPLTEELLLRGALWRAFEHHQVPRYVIVALTALIFAFLHEESWRTISLFAQGLAIGWARMITGRVGASVIAHATNNLLPAVYLYFAAA